MLLNMILLDLKGLHRNAPSPNYLLKFDEIAVELSSTRNEKFHKTKAKITQLSYRYIPHLQFPHAFIETE